MNRLRTNLTIDEYLYLLARVVEHIIGCHQFDASNMWIRFTTLLEVF